MKKSFSNLVAKKATTEQTVDFLVDHVRSLTEDLNRVINRGMSFENLPFEFQQINVSSGAPVVVGSKALTGKGMILLGSVGCKVVSYTTEVDIRGETTLVCNLDKDRGIVNVLIVGEPK